MELVAGFQTHSGYRISNCTLHIVGISIIYGGWIMVPKFSTSSFSFINKLLESSSAAKSSASAAIANAADVLRSNCAEAKKNGALYTLKDKLSDYRARRWMEKEWKKPSVAALISVRRNATAPSLHQVNDRISAAFTRDVQSTKSSQWDQHSKEKINKLVTRYEQDRLKLGADLAKLNANLQLARHDPVEFCRRSVELINARKVNGNRLANLRNRATVAKF
jgi:hypothetical protein